MGDKLLALNMIVGANETELLKRCLQSAKADSVFDEIIIVYTGPSINSGFVSDIVSKYGGQLYFYEWETDRYPHGNFAGARNLALKHTTAKYWMWLDADDVIDDSFSKTFNELKKFLNNDIDLFFVPYNLVFDKSDKVVMKLDRERIIKNRPDIFWCYPVHEQLTVDISACRCADIKNSFTVNHRPVKDHTVSAERNLKILKHECSLTSDVHLQYYLAREYWNSGEYEKSVAMFKEIIDNGNGPTDALAVACLKVAEYYLYDNCEKGKEQVFKKTLQEAETYCRISFSFSSEYAEPHVFLGDIYSKRKDYKKAINFYKQAMKTKFNGPGIQDIKYYTKIPAFRLCQLFTQLGKLEDGLMFSRIALDYSPENKDIHVIRHGILEKLIRQYRD